ncbi:queuosine precursor transporter [Afifella pfennigii]|uniref:queuosine precursor transporter n=1 Tax=Afifella pfennigii TaxID=209897 RepID=UPI00047CAAC8|nr:queuosine precursor transporter [Afifella pfennigii]
MPQLSRRTGFLLGIAAMAAVVVASNILVQFPVHLKVGALNLADLLTYGAFTYPLAFLVNDMTNRAFGPAAARKVVLVGFALAVILSVLLASPRIAVASGSAFLLAQLLDVGIFHRLRAGSWWRAPALSSLVGSALDTVVFFSLAFAVSFSVLGPNDAFAIEAAPLLGVFALEVPRWVSWALGDFSVKLLVAALALIPYGFLVRLVTPWQPSRAAAR